MSERADHSDDDVIVVAEDGDVILCVTHDIGQNKQSVRFRTSTIRLRATSKYFDKLLGDARFGEGRQISKAHEELRIKYGSAGQGPSKELPILHIEHIGRISSVKFISALLTDFFSILHNTASTAILPVANLANLAIVADRFDALATVSEHFNRKKAFQAADRKLTSKQEAALTEEKIRQRLLIGLLLDYAPWVEKYSARLIIRDRTADASRVPDVLWWDLPGRIDEEIDFRRACILQTLQDLQSTYLELYSSRTRQCRLGYDSSSQCDSFQFGEMTRFFLRLGTLRFTGTLQPAEADEASYEGDVNALIEQLRQVPEYQIDSNHSHCGIRTRLVPALNLIAGALAYIGIDGDSWRETRDGHRWSMAKRPLTWSRVRHTPFGSVTSPEQRHELVRSLFMAEERQWE